MRSLSFPYLIVALALTPPAWAEVAGKPACDMPEEFITPAESLPAVALAITERRPVEILALGSGSTVGESGGAGGPAFKSVNTPAASFPYRMVDSLQAMRPAAKFHLTIAGGRNMTADSMLPLLHHQLAAHRYDLIMWQTGTVEAVRGVRPDTLHSVLEDGVAAAGLEHADIVLIDPQFSRFLRANIDLGPYESVLEQVASLPGVTLFRRFELTQTWVASGQVDLERVEHTERDRTIALLNTCLGEALAKYVLTGADEH